MKVQVRYMTEFGGRTTTLNLNELVKFVYRFKVLSIKEFVKINLK